MTLENYTLEERVKQFKDTLQYDTTVPYYTQIIRENKLTIVGNNDTDNYNDSAAIKVEYGAKQNDNIKDHYGFRIFTIANGKMYVLTYQDEALKVPETLPLANKMVESFQVGVTK